MATTHGLPDTLHEMQALAGDLLPACILSTTWPVVPASSLTLDPFATYGYALAGRDLVYIEQPAVSVTLPSAAGTYWLGLHRDLSSPVSGWTRRVGSHYLFQLAASQPAAPDGAVLVSSVTVAGSVITAVSQTGIRRAPMSQQDASAVAITGGTATFTTGLTSTGANTTLDGTTLVVNVAQHRVNINPVGGTNPGLDCVPQAYFRAPVGVQTTPSAGSALKILFAKNTQYGLWSQASDTDAGASPNVVFVNVAGTGVGTIFTTATATSYNTSSDVRLKHAIAPLTDALARIQALRPVSFRWQADGSPGIGFLAHEAQQVIPEAVTGVPDAVDEQGKIVPQQIDHSKLVPWLCAAVQELAAQVQTLTASITTLEEALGL